MVDEIRDAIDWILRLAGLYQILKPIVKWAKKKTLKLLKRFK